MTPAKELANYIAQQGAGTRGGDVDWSIHVSEEPTAPDDVITLYDTGGSDPLLVAMQQPTVQVRVRARNYEEAYEKQTQIRDLLVEVEQQSIGTHYYVGIFQQSDVMSLGKDDRRRVRLTANYRIIRQPL